MQVLSYGGIKMKRRQRTLWTTVLIALFTAMLLFTTAQAQEGAQPNVDPQATDLVVYLPFIAAGNAPAAAGNDFTPTTNTELAGGTLTFETFTIPAGITVTLGQSTTLQIDGDTVVNGALIADCIPLTINGQGNFAITGAIDNRCTDENAQPAPLKIVVSGTLQIGTGDQPAQIESSGDLIISNAPTLRDSDFNLLPEQQSAGPMAPVCSAVADTIWETTFPDDPGAIRFFAEGIDPDGGSVTHRWDFGDGTPETSGADLLHTFTLTGTHTVTLTTTDDEGDTCHATLGINIENGTIEQLPTQPAVQMQPIDLVVAVGEVVSFTATAVDSQDETLTHTWSYGDGTIDTVVTGTHSYATAGRYEVGLTVADSNDENQQANAWLYVYEESQPNTPFMAAGNTAAAPICGVANPAGVNVINPAQITNPPQAGAGKDGANRTWRVRGNTMIARGVQIYGQDGGDGADQNRVGTARGQRGGDGGGIRVQVAGELTVCAGVTLWAGHGGDGGDATATATPGNSARAIGGRGGNAGRETLFVASRGITFEEATVTIDGGDGGDGGTATATGGNGQDKCTTAQDGGNATAIGGHGGRASKAAIARGRVTGTANATLAGGLGGFGGAADATAGNGGNADCAGTAHGGDAGYAYARAGNGGHAFLSGRWRVYTVAPTAYQAGDGGEATATGGKGGIGTATGAACSAATASGGNGGFARAQGGNGGRGRHDGEGSAGKATGGNGGDSKATGGDCTLCKDGGDAKAAGGNGGNSEAKAGRRTPAATQAQSIAGHGGDATAQGGRGGDCPECPGGKGGNGGEAAGTGGDGGNARGSRVTKVGGNGGEGDATGGEGGDGAECCGPPHLQGGNGGDGGKAISRAGAAGTPGGNVGANATKGGDGGDGGDGIGIGVGGAGGLGDGKPVFIPNGFPGLDGELCPVPTPTPTIDDPTPQPTATVGDPTPIPSETPMPTETPTPDPTTPPVERIVVTTAATRIAPGQPIDVIVKLEGPNGEVVDAPEFFELVLQVMSEFNPTGITLPVEYIGDGCYRVIFILEQPDQYWLQAILHRLDNNTFLQSEPLLIEVIEERGG